MSLKFVIASALIAITSAAVAEPSEPSNLILEEVVTPFASNVNYCDQFGGKVASNAAYEEALSSALASLQAVGAKDPAKSLAQVCSQTAPYRLHAIAVQSAAKPKAQ